MVMTSLARSDEPFFTGLGLPPGIASASITRATDVSQDGSLVVGYVGIPVLQERAFRLTVGGGMALLAPDFPFSFANGVSADGSVVVGQCADRYVACRWTSAEGIVRIPRLLGYDYNQASSTGASADGSVIVGHIYDTFNSTQQAFRWTSAGGTVGLGDLPGGASGSLAWDISADGSVIVGWCYSDSGRETFRWTSAGGKH